MSKYRSFTGCWICRLRRKKCDEKRPECQTCAELSLTCYYDETKPDWMDGGVKQKQMLEDLKHQVKRSAPSRRWRIRPEAEQTSGSSFSLSPPRGDTQHSSEQHRTTTVINNDHQDAIPLDLIPNFTKHALSIRPHPTRSATDCIVLREFEAAGAVPFERADTVLISLYQDHLFPFLFPLYNPSPKQGGKSWVLELFLSSPVFREAALCHSKHWIEQSAHLETHGKDLSEASWEGIFKQTQKTFKTLRVALQTVDQSYVRQHLRGSVRILASILQLQRFELTLRNFRNYKIHLDASLAFYIQIIDSCRQDVASSGTSLTTPWHILHYCLGPPNVLSSSLNVQTPSSEQAAFGFLTTFLVLEDILSSIVTQTQPVLYRHYLHLFDNNTNGDRSDDFRLDFSSTIGCQNLPLFCIGQVAALDAQKQQDKQAGNLNMLELLTQAKNIKDRLKEGLQKLGTHETISHTAFDTMQSGLSSHIADAPAQGFQRSRRESPHTWVITQIWAHAALIYLSVVTSGWQPTSDEISLSVKHIIDFISLEAFPKSLLRVIAWPFFVAGCCASDPEQQSRFRAIFHHHVSLTDNERGPLHEAMELLEVMWTAEDDDEISTRDFSTCFSRNDFPVFLV